MLQLASHPSVYALCPSTRCSAPSPSPSPTSLPQLPLLPSPSSSRSQSRDSPSTSLIRRQRWQADSLPRQSTTSFWVAGLQGGKALAREVLAQFSPRDCEILTPQSTAIRC